MSKSKKNVIEPDEILESFGIDATRLFMISDSPPERELEWTDEGIQSSKNFINRIKRYFKKEKSELSKDTNKQIDRFIHEMEKNILSFSLNKCVANIYTLFNYLEKNKVYLNNSDLSKKILTCLYPVLPGLAISIKKELFGEENIASWPNVDGQLLIDDEINLPIQVKGKLVTTINTKKGYDEDKILDSIYKLDKIKNKIENKKIIRVINVQDKIINIITI